MYPPSCCIFQSNSNAADPQRSRTANGISILKLFYTFMVARGGCIIVRSVTFIGILVCVVCVVVVVMIVMLVEIDNEHFGCFAKILNRGIERSARLVAVEHFVKKVVRLWINWNLNLWFGNIKRTKAWSFSLLSPSVSVWHQPVNLQKNKKLWNFERN